ncbi:TonB-dependent receptor [Halioxenophilus sp. WMMB6]|uniref:TonB-dependent receptor n=1 Tax=Halioxenophilus sp. WMMB6 TaxID=3073815 RepID=UPI00295E9F89|nr:TonB-dependent receptor [Halioxenophilus sp. WMMB6]
MSVAVGLAASAAQVSVAQEGHVLQLEEIVVTAERRSANVQDIPIAMTAMTSDQLEKKAVTRLDDLQYAAPSLSVTDAAITQSVNIRGIGLASGDPNASNGVGTYIDGLFQPPIVGTMSFYDLNDVQVLRGPQGTFSGANSTGGAIMINSKLPEVGGEFNGYLRVGAGSYSAINTEGAIGIPVTETVAVRAAFKTSERDSYYDDIGPANTDAGSLDETRFRLGVAWQPTDNIDLYVKYETSDKDTGGYPNRPIEGSDFAFGRTDDIWDISYNTDTKHKESDDTYLIDTQYTFDNGVGIKLLAGHQEKEIDVVWDYDATSILSLEETQFIEEDQDSYELNIISPDDARLQWVLGYYFQKNDVSVDIQTPGPRILLGIEKETKGLFGQVGYDLTKDLQVEFGVRQAWYDAAGLEGSGGYFGPVSAGPAFPISGDYDDDDLLGKLSVNWAYDNDNLIYASLAKGYKPGGYNNTHAEDNFNKESVWAYELGWKSTMLDGAVRTAVALFYNDYEDFQFDSIDITSGSSGVLNVGKATIQGVEFSIDGQFGGLRMDAGFSYIDSELNPVSSIVDERSLPGGASNLPQCVGGATPPACFDYTPYLVSTSGGDNLYSPGLSYTLGVEYEFTLFNGATLIPRLNYGWVDEQWVNLLYDKETDLLESRGLLSALVTFETNNWIIQAYGRNLTNKEYVSGQYNSLNAEYFGAPRVVGMNVSYSF